jgi:hypothetical protein
MTNASPASSDTPAVVPRREGVIHPPPVKERTIEWRAIVHVGDLDTASATPTEWHAAQCENAAAPERHCAEGRRLIDESGQPDGHCLVKGRCVRCQAEARARRKAA